MIKLGIFKGCYLAYGSSECNNPSHFLKELNKIFQMHVNSFSKLCLIFCWHQQKMQKWAIFDISITITLGANMTTRETTPFFSSTPWALSVGIFHFCISRRPKDISRSSVLGGPPLLCYFLVCKIHIYMPKMTLSRLLILISFFYIKFANFPIW